MRHSFEPFGPAEAAILSEQLGIDFSRIDFSNPRWLCVRAIDEDGDLWGVCAIEFQNYWEAEFNIALRHWKALSRRVMRATFKAVFSRAVRLTAHVRPDNAKALHGAQRLGFQIEGFQRRVIEGRHDAIVLGMLAEDCVYLREPRLPAAFPVNEVSDDENAIPA